MARIEKHLPSVRLTTSMHPMNTANGPEAETLSVRQMEIRSRLERNKTGLGDRYAGMIWAIESAGPDRWAQAAHSARELIQDVVRIKEFEPAESLPEPRSARDAVRNSWSTYRASQGLKDKDLRELIGTPITQKLMRVMERVEQYYLSSEAHEPSRRKQVERAVGPLALVDPELPEELRDEDIQTFFEMWKFFVKAAHHGESNGDIEAMVEKFDAFLARWVPETSSDLDAIDELLRGQ